MTLNFANNVLTINTVATVWCSCPFKPPVKLLPWNGKEGWPAMGADMGVFSRAEPLNQMLHIGHTQSLAGLDRVGLAGKNCCKLLQAAFECFCGMAIQQLMERITNYCCRINVCHAGRHGID